MSMARLPHLLTDMDPQSLSIFAAALASANLFIPSTLQVLGNEAVLKADFFNATQAAGEPQRSQTRVSRPSAPPSCFA